MLKADQILLDDMSMFANLYVEDYKNVSVLEDKYANMYKVKDTCRSWNDAFCDMYKVTQFPDNMWDYTNMKYADSIFAECRHMTKCPIDFTKTNAVIMYDAFWNCSRMTEAPELPKTVTNLKGCFSACANIESAVDIPEGAKNCREMFLGCEKITTAPVIPSSVTNVIEMFNYCTNLRGEVYVYTNNLSNCYEFVGNEEYAKTIYCFANTTTYNSLVNAKEEWWNATIKPFNVVNSLSEVLNTSSPDWRGYSEIPEEYTLKNGIETSSVKDFSNSFKNGVGIATLPDPFYNMASSVNCSGMFYECNSLEDVSSLKFGENTQDLSKCFWI